MALNQTTQILLYLIAFIGAVFSAARLYKLDRKYFNLNNTRIHIASRVHTDRAGWNEVEQQINAARLEAWFFLMVFFTMVGLAITVFIIS